MTFKQHNTKAQILNQIPNRSSLIPLLEVMNICGLFNTLDMNTLELYFCIRLPTKSNGKRANSTVLSPETLQPT